MKHILFFLLLIAVAISPPPPGSTFVLTFQYAARSNVAFQSCLGDVIWNNVIVFSVVPTDYNMHSVSVDVTAVVGENSLQFEGAGRIDSFGLTITNVALIELGDLTNSNVLINGDFSLPNLGGGWTNYNSIPGWTAYTTVLQIGAGQIYNNVWSSSIQVIQLDASVNFEITQILTFDSNFYVIANSLPPTCATSALFPPPVYTLQFDWAPNNVGTSNLLTSQANVIWDNLVIASLLPTTNGVNHFSQQVTPDPCGHNTLQFDGTEESDGFGISISNVKVTRASSNTNLLNGVWVVDNAQFANCSHFNTHWTAAECFSLDSGTNQRYTQTITFPALLPFDIVGPLTKTAFGCLYQQNYVYANVRIDSNTLGVIDPNAIQTLQNAKASGLQTAIYMILCPGFNLAAQVAIIQAIPANLYSTLWLKVKENRNPVLTSECIWQNYDHTYNCQFLLNVLSAISPIQTGIFSTKRIWDNVFGNSCNLGQTGSYYLWYGNYQTNGILDPTQSFADFNAYGGFGGWIDADLKQTIGSQRITLCNNAGWHALLSIDWHP